MFAFCTAAHCLLSTGLDGWLYYLSAGFTDVVIIGLLATTHRVSGTTGGLILVSICSVVLNIYGQVLWISYLPADSYNNAFTLLYALSVLIIIRGDDAGDFNIFDLFSPASKSRSILGHLSKEARD